MDSLLTQPDMPAYQQIVLLIDQPDQAASSLVRFLQTQQVQLLHADSGEQALDMLLEHDVALVLADIDQPGMDGYDITRWVRANSRTRHIPVILLGSGAWDQASIERAHAAGAIDYLSKPVSGAVLASKVAAPLELERNRRRLSQAISHIDSLKEQLQRQAVTDHLTGLNNRSGFKAAFRMAMERARRARKSVALMFIDLDHFKRINDTLGHGVGDFLLAAVAQRLRECVRSYDIVSRIGGDEFSVVLDALDDASGAAHIAGKILSALRMPFRLEDGMQVTISASIGIASYPECSDDIDLLMQAAGVAMYQAKSDGRNLYHFYMPEMNAKARHRLMLEQALRVAVEDDEFFLHYQPQVDIGSGRVVGFEALLRWDHQRIGRVAPSTFVPMLEETGLIIPMGQWVFSTGCRQRHAWGGMLPEQCSLSVNLSPRQFADKNLVPQIRRVLEMNQLPAYQLEIELTESMLMSNTEHTRGLLRSLKDLGLKLSVDDFGTGYSSLAYLKQFALDALKIDKQFIDHLTTSRKDEAIARSIIQLGHNLGMQVIAEGVESAEQVEVLQQLGCDVVQGFYFGRPVPAGEVTRLPHAMTVGER
jgi:diguanylate cyclase (GGDEF)-like protein